MYLKVRREDVVRIPPERLGEDIDELAKEFTRTLLEGRVGADKSLTLIASNVERVGEGRIVRGDVDEENQRLIGKDTKRDVRIGDKVRARIVAVSLNERAPRESKIGLTMRQPGLGKFDWLEDERKKVEGRPKRRR